MPGVVLAAVVRFASVEVSVVVLVVLVDVLRLVVVVVVKVELTVVDDLVVVGVVALVVFSVVDTVVSAEVGCVVNCGSALDEPRTERETVSPDSVVTSSSLPAVDNSSVVDCVVFTVVGS